MSETACFHKPTEQNMEKAPQVQAFYTAGKTEAQIRGRSQMIGTHTHKRVWFLKWTSKQIHTHPKKTSHQTSTTFHVFFSKCHVFAKTSNVSPRNQQTLTNDVFPHKKTALYPP